TFRTLFRTFAAIFEEPPVEGGSGALYGLFSCPITHCCYTVLPLIPTSCKRGDPFLPLRGEPHGFRFPAGRTPNDNQAPCFEGLQTMTEVALVPWQGPDRKST